MFLCVKDRENRVRCTKINGRFIRLLTQLLTNSTIKSQFNLCHLTISITMQWFDHKNRIFCCLLCCFWNFEHEVPSQPPNSHLFICSVWTRLLQHSSYRLSAAHSEASESPELSLLFSRLTNVNMPHHFFNGYQLKLQ